MDNHFKSNGIITLTTDFGLSDPFVGVMKGVILGRFPGATLVDLTHGIQPYGAVEAGFWLVKSFGYFPAGTVHVAVVDPGVGTARNILIAQIEEHVFLAPDNGLLSLLLGSRDNARIYRLASPPPSGFLDWPTSATFHGRDIFAPVAAELASGRVQPQDLGDLLSEVAVGADAHVRVGPGSVRGVIVTIDRFGNLITNIEARHLQAFASPEVHVQERRFPFVRTYGEASPGADVALVNAFGVVEIARVQGDAGSALKLTRGMPVLVQEKNSPP